MLLVFITGLLAAQPHAEMLRQLFQQALERRKSEHGVHDARTAQAARDLGQFLAKEGNTRGAREALALALEADEKALGPTAARTLADAAELAAVSARAEPLWLRASASTDADVAARSFAALGGFREEQGDRAGAAKLYRLALAREEAASGKDSTRVAARLNTLALVSDPPEAIALLERALRITAARPGQRRLESASVQLNLAALLLNSGGTARAAQLARDATVVLEEMLGDHPRTALGLMLQARALHISGDLSGAEERMRRALAIDERVLGSRHAQTRNDARALVELLRGSGRAGEATELEKRISAEP